jgi:hypothetical protein
MAEPKKPDIQPDFLNSLFGLGTKSKKKRNLVWESDLPECEIGEFLIVPLTTSRHLRAEGRMMRHCAGTYDELCHNGLARVFSIRDLAGHRLATASLIWRDDYWHLEQVKGLRNAEVLESESTFFDGNSTVTLLEPTELYYIGQEILRRYRCSWSDRLHNYVCGLMKA